jgi:cytochrome c peroxidase
LWNSSPGHRVWRQVNAMSAWQNTLVPPAGKIPADTEAASRGRAVFESAGCAKCHSGPALTNNRIIAVTEIKTEPTRAKGMSNTEKAWNDKPLAYAFDQDVPLPKSPRTIPVPVEHLDKEQITLAYGWGESPGGYKVPALVGLYWTAPYLHDGGGRGRSRCGGAARPRRHAPARRHARSSK